MTWDGKERRGNAEVAAIIRSAIKEAFETIPSELDLMMQGERDWVQIQMAKEKRRQERWDYLKEKTLGPFLVALIAGAAGMIWAYIKEHWI